MQVPAQVSQWLHTTFQSKDVALQLGLILLSLVVSFFLKRILDLKLSKRHQLAPSLSVLRLNLSTPDFAALIVVNGLTWLAIAISTDMQLGTSVLHGFSGLLIAWSIIRIGAGTIKNHHLARGVAVILFLIAVLNAVGLLVPLSNAMSKVGLKVGQIDVTLLLVAKSILAFGVLLWGTYFFSSVMERIFKRSKGLTPSQQVLFFKISNLLLYGLAISVGLNIVGIDLAALAVFSGALGLGIGFGLQKVFSNLISGIILLLDKSVKPGDVISVGDTFGWVNSLSARYVSVLTREGKEHLIPNENLISQQVENWSYSNQQVRIRIPVGVSYNADLHVVKKLLLESVSNHPRILTEPKPAVFLSGFGDSSVDHEIAVWITDPEEGISNLRSDVYYKIWDLFKENGVEIPFPQRDVHIKTS